MTHCPTCDCPLERYGCHNECKEPPASRKTVAQLQEFLCAEVERFKEQAHREDSINWPSHYNESDIQPIDVIEAWELDHHTACVVKYIARHRHKGSELEDLRKARWYLDRAIARRTNGA